MALINCPEPECNKRISDKAKACPYCGCPSDALIINRAASTPKTVNIITQQKSVTEELNPELQRISNSIMQFFNVFNNLLSKAQYLARSDHHALIQDLESIRTELKPIVLEYIKEKNAAFYNETILKFIEIYDNHETIIDKHNKEYIKDQLTRNKDYFDGIFREADPNVLLDLEQREAILTDEDYCLVIAGAGAGKTTTMAAKVKYLIDKQKINPNDIVIVSFTNKAVDELEAKIVDGLKIPAKVMTFHKFGNEILKLNKTAPPRLVYDTYNAILDILSKTIFHDYSLLKNLLLFFSYYLNVPLDALQFRNLEEYHAVKAKANLESLKSTLGEYNFNAILVQQKKLKTINNELLRSDEEVQIANFLYLNGIDYEYEKEYEFIIKDAKKPYTPDFFIWQGDKKCYLEHFGITQSLEHSQYSKEDLRKYTNSMQYKISLHKQHNTVLITTFSKYNDGRQLIQHLKEELVSRNFELKPRSDKEVYQKLIDSAKERYVKRFAYLSTEFIKLFKTNGYSAANFADLRRRTDNVRSLLFLDIMEKVFYHYQSYLKDNNMIDFEDMINDAEFILRQGEVDPKNLNYKYIIVDEYQDIVRQRYNLMKTLSDLTHAKVVAVGDDWQSIFAFSGSDLTLFTSFVNQMGYGQELKITHTYRNSQELIDIAGKFVQENKNQIKKSLISPKSIQHPVIISTYDDSTAIDYHKAVLVEQTIGKIIQEFGINKEILLIGRYGFDGDHLVETGLFYEGRNKGRLISKKYPKAILEFNTAHSSKGLGRENVIIINAINSFFGFPAQIEDDPIMRLVRIIDEGIDFAEERRLFYVALTRTKNNVYILAPRNKPSKFVLELLENNNNVVLQGEINRDFGGHIDKKKRCPICSYPLKREKNKYFPGTDLHICTNEPEICDFMTNSLEEPQDIYKCPECRDGYMIVNKNKTTKEFFMGCTNYRTDKKGCNNTDKISRQKT